MEQQEDSEIKALLNLLDDPDEEVYQHIRSKLISFGGDVIPSLESVWEFNSLGVLFQDRIEDIVHQIQFDQLKSDLNQWINSSQEDLMKVMLILNKYQYPELNEKEIIGQIKTLSREIWIELNDELTAFEKVKIFNTVLYNKHGFKGNKQNYHSPNNSFLSTVLETKKGNPLLLSVLYMLIAKELDEPIVGINLPHHFVTAYIDKHNIAQLVTYNNTDVLFYINCFSNGQILNRKELESFLAQINIDKEASFFEPCSNIDIVTRVLHNLIHSYNQAGLIEKVEELEQLLELVKAYKV